MQWALNSQGYQLYKNNKLYGSILPGHVHNMTLKSLKLGESLNLRLVAVPKEQELLESGQGDAGEGGCFDGFEFKINFKKMLWKSVAVLLFLWISNIYFMNILLKIILVLIN